MAHGCGARQVRYCGVGVGLQDDAENCFSINAVTKPGIAAVKSEASRTRWIAESSGRCCRLILASIRARSASPGISTFNILIIAITAPEMTQSQCAAAR